MGAVRPSGGFSASGTILGEVRVAQQVKDKPRRRAPGTVIPIERDRHGADLLDEADDLLDEIDDLLEDNACEVLIHFRQKGGQ